MLLADGPQRLLAISVLARLPMAMIGIGLLVHVQSLTGSLAAAGLVTGAVAAAHGVGGPLLGRAVDRFGQTAVLLASAAASGATLVAIALQPPGASRGTLVGLAAVLGLVIPPVGECLRALLPSLLRDRAAISTAYAVEATAVELTFIVGPPLVLVIGRGSSTGGALCVVAATITGATCIFATQAGSRSWRPAAMGRGRRGGALRAPGMRTLVAVLVAVGVVFGAVEVGVAAAAVQHSQSGATGWLLGLWGLGSFLGGLAAARRGGGARTGSGLVVLLVALAAAHLALAAVASNILALGALVLLAGATIAPTYASVFTMADRAAPAGTQTEAFAWLNTAVSVGAAGGAAIAGVVADVAGSPAVFALAGAAGAIAALTAARTNSLPHRAFATAKPAHTGVAA